MEPTLFLTSILFLSLSLSLSLSPLSLSLSLSLPLPSCCSSVFFVKNIIARHTPHIPNEIPEKPKKRWTMRIPKAYRVDEIETIMMYNDSDLIRWDKDKVNNDSDETEKYWRHRST